jgi:hypothetical protein
MNQFMLIGHQKVDTLRDKKDRSKYKWAGEYENAQGC